MNKDQEVKTVNEVNQEPVALMDNLDSVDLPDNLVEQDPKEKLGN